MSVVELNFSMFGRTFSHSPVNMGWLTGDCLQNLWLIGELIGVPLTRGKNTRMQKRTKIVKSLVFRLMFRGTPNILGISDKMAIKGTNR